MASPWSSDPASRPSPMPGSRHHAPHDHLRVVAGAERQERIAKALSDRVRLGAGRPEASTTIRLDPAVPDGFRAAGPGRRSRIDGARRKAAGPFRRADRGAGRGGPRPAPVLQAAGGAGPRELTRGHDRRAMRAGAALWDPTPPAGGLRAGLAAGVAPPHPRRLVGAQPPGPGEIPGGSSGRRPAGQPTRLSPQLCGGPPMAPWIGRSSAGRVMISLEACCRDSAGNIPFKLPPNLSVAPPAGRSITRVPAASGPGGRARTRGAGAWPAALLRPGLDSGRPGRRTAGGAVRPPESAGRSRPAEIAAPPVESVAASRAS